MTQHKNTVIRRFQSDDLGDIFDLYSHQAVIEHTSQKPFLSLDQVNSLFNQPERHVLVVQIEQSVVGHVTLFLSNKPREKHCAGIAIAVHPREQGKGLGKLLMQEAINQADNWLNLLRIELDVYSDNHTAIALYEKLGFIKEGERKMASFKNGKYADLIIMARLNSNKP